MEIFTQNNMEPTKTLSLYKGKITIDFFEGKHSYVIRETGKRPLSVTACTGIIDKSRPLIFWAVGLAKNHLLENLQNGKAIDEAIIEEACKQHQVFKKAAADIGTEVHEWAENWIKTKIKERKDLKLPDNEKAANGAIAFLKWVDENKIKFIASEQIVYSKKHDYVGIMDCKFTMGKEKHKIIHAGDFKTSKGIYNEYRYQVAGYQGADEEESGEVYGTKWLMRFGKDDGEFEAHEYGDHEKDYKTFLACLAIKKREKELTVYAPF